MTKTNTKAKVSVVVPIYNVERYLRQCLDSIVGQTLKDIEIILVDDGSTDGCPAIVDEYAAKDKRIVALHKKNGGLGAAYNCGIAAATGIYVGLVESDDWIEPDMYKTLYQRAKETDAQVIKCNFWQYRSMESGVNQNKPEVLEFFNLRLNVEKEAPTKVFDIVEYPILAAKHSSVWSGIYKSDFVKKIKFTEAKGAGYVDMGWTFDVLCRAKKIAIVPRELYHWRLDDHGNSTSCVNAGCLAMADRSLETKEIAKKSGKWKSVAQAYYIQVFNGNIGFFTRCNDADAKYKYFLKLQQIFGDFDPKDSPVLAKMKNFIELMKELKNGNYDYFNPTKEDILNTLLRKYVKYKVMQVLSFGLIKGFRKRKNEYKKRIENLLINL